MSPKVKDNLSPEERRENALRPCRYLGYDHDRLGMYLLSRGADKIAEAAFRRAVWLNPYEIRFLCHLAWSLYKQGRYHEAQHALEHVDLKQVETDEDMQMIVERVKGKSL